MKTKHLVAATLLLFILPVIAAQDIKKADYKYKEVEIGVVEHLGDTIPLDLWFYNEENEKVTLRELIDKPVILCLVYFDCPNI